MSKAFTATEILERIDELVREGRSLPGELDEMCEGLRIYTKITGQLPDEFGLSAGSGYYALWQDRRDGTIKPEDWPRGTKATIAETANVSRQYLDRVLSGSVVPRVGTAKRICDSAYALGIRINVSTLLGLEN